MKSDYSVTQSVIEIGKLNFKGNIIPERWFQALTYESGRPHINAIIILSEIVYWYRPTEIRDESSGLLIETKKKFKADLLQRNYQGFSKKFGFSKKQVQDAFDYLRSMGLIYTELRTITVGDDLRLPNVLFIGVNPEKIKEITFGEIKLSGTGSVPVGTDPYLLGTDTPTPGHDRHNQGDTHTKTTKKSSTKSSSKKNKRPPNPQSTGGSVIVSEENPIALETPDPIATEQPKPELTTSSTLALIEKENVPPPELGSLPVIRTVEDVDNVLDLCPALKKKESVKNQSDAFDSFCKLFRESWKAHAPEFPAEVGNTSAIAKAWDQLFKGTKNPSALAERIVEGTSVYWENKRITGNRHALSAPVFLRNGVWNQAFEDRDTLTTSKTQSAQKFAPFLTCFNQDKPMRWPEAIESDLGPKSTGRLEELIASCNNSLERFQKALLFCKRNNHWGLERSLTFEEFLYCGKINDFYRKQINDEALGLDKTIAPTKKDIEAAASRQQSQIGILKRLREDFQSGDLTRDQFRKCLQDLGIDPESIPEAR